MGASPDISAIILCGGKSSRMGEPKALLEIEGRPLIGKIIAVAGEVAGEVLLVTSDPEPYREFGLPLITGEIPDRGPLEGLRVGLAAANGDLVFALSCDLPGLKSGPFHRMLELIGERRALVPESDRGPEPLCALYRKECGASLADALDRGERALHRAVAMLDPVRPDSTALGAAPTFFANLNTPDDVALWRRES